MTKAEAIEVLKAFKMCAKTTMTISYRGNFAIPIEAIDMAIKALEQDKVLCLGDLDRKCKHCTVKGETKHYCYCDIWGSVVNPRGWCNYGERDEKEGEKSETSKRVTER